MTAFGTDQQPTGQLVSGVNHPAGAISFSPSLDHLTVGGGWATWSNGYTGDVYASGLGGASATSVTVTLPAGTDAFYLYAEPDPFAVINITATTDDGTSSGDVPVQGDAGAQYFGFYTDGSVSINTITVSSSTDFAIGEFGINTGGGSTCTTPPNPPKNVTNANHSGGGSGIVTVNWNAPDPTCDPVDHYEIVPIHSDGTIGDSVDSVPAGTTSDTISNLNLCTFYRYGVLAVDPNGQQSLGSPATPAFTAGLPKSSPPVVTILLQGVSTSLPGSSWNPVNTSYCTSTDGNNADIGQFGQVPAFASLASNWLNVSDAGKADYAGPGAGNNLIDSTASTGGLVLPFSYNGAAVTGTATSPMFTAQSYNDSDVANSLPVPEAGTLNTEINSINRLWPNAKIIVVGHSEGGLIAQQWWWNYGQYIPQGVVQVFSLDSPINGVYAGTICNSQKPADKVACQILSAFIPVSHKLLTYYGTLWRNQATNDQKYLAADLQDGLYTPVITYGDPLYDTTDYGALKSGSQDTNIGWVSQGLVNEPNCVMLNWQQGCHLVGADDPDICTYNDGTSQFFGMPGDLWVHSRVKNCSSVITDVMKYVTS